MEIGDDNYAEYEVNDPFATSFLVRCPAHRHLMFRFTLSAIILPTDGRYQPSAAVRSSVDCHKFYTVIAGHCRIFSSYVRVGKPSSVDWV